MTSLEEITIPATGSKYTLPDVSDTVERQRLFSILDENRKKPVTLVLGQAAQGKSTLIASYLKQSAQQTAWIHLDEDDSDPTNLFYLVIHALKKTLNRNNSFKEIQYPRTTLGSRRDIQRHREILRTVFAAVTSETAMVMDDLDSLYSNAPSFTLIQGIIEELPPNIRLFLLSRHVPDLSLQKLKLEKKIFVLNNHHLAFTFDETKRFFSKRKGMDSINSSKIIKIHAITGGWAGGLTLLAETITRSSDMNRLPEHLKGEAVEFFGEEIFSVQPDEIKDFLVKASFFDTIDPDIMAHFSSIANPMKILTGLEKRNLFIQKLEQENSLPLFRFHKLFRDFLRNILHAQTSEDQYKKLCKKAGDLFYQRKVKDLALKYYLKSRSWDKARQQIKKMGTDLLIKGRFTDLSQWIESLPEEIIWKDPWLIYYLTMTRRISGGRKNIDDFITALSLFREKEDIRGIMLCLAHLIEAAVFLQTPRQNLDQWINKGEDLLVSIQGKQLFSYARTVLWQQIGFGYIAGLGETVKGISACRNAIILAESIHNPDLKRNAVIVSILGHVLTGEFETADQELSSINQPDEEKINPEYRALKNLVAIELLLKKGEIEKAGQQLKASETDIEKFGLLFIYPGFIEAKAMYHIYQEEYRHAELLANHLSDVSILADNQFYLGLSHRIKAIGLYHMELVEKACREVEKNLGILDKKQMGSLHLFNAKQLYGLLLIHLKKYKEAELLLKEALVYFRKTLSFLSEAETLCALGILMWETHRTKEALSFLSQGVDKAEKEGYRHFIIMSPKDLTRAILLTALLCREQVSEFISSLISTRLSNTAVKEIEALSKIPRISKKKALKDRLKQLYCQTMPKLRLLTLGRFKVLKLEKTVHEIKFEGNKPGLLLKSIILHGSTNLPKDILIEDIWPESDEISGEKKFKVNLHRLRKTLEPDVKKGFGYAYLKLESGFISLNPELVSLDIDEFNHTIKQGDLHRKSGRFSEAINQYEAAATLYKGDFLAEEPYADFLALKRNTLKRAYIDLLQQTAVLYEELNRDDKAILFWTRLIQADPLFEPGYQQLMRLYSRQGMTSHALRIFSDCKRSINHEIGVEPDKKTMEIYRKIREGK